MKKLFLCFAAAIFLGTLAAAMPGDRPGESRYKLEWLNSSPMPLGKINPERDKNIPGLRAVVFMFTRAKDSDSTIILLENLRRHHQGKVLIAAITPDHVSEAEVFLKKHRDARIRFAVDTERRLTPEMMRDSAMIFPMAFLLDAEGTVLWRGEAVDLPEAVEKSLAGKLQMDVQKKAAAQINEMHKQMRSGNMEKIIECAEKVLKTDPGNPAALRMAIFAAESISDHRKAWKIVSGELKTSPDQPRIYFSALDLAIRHRDLLEELPELIKKFAATQFFPPVKLAFCGALLESFPYNADAVLGAKMILAGIPMPLNIQPAQMGQILSIRARLHYALGDLKSAEADMKEAVQCFKKSDDASSLAAATRQAEFFRTLLDHLAGEKR